MRTPSYIAPGKVRVERPITQRMILVCIIAFAHAGVVALFMRDGIPLRAIQPEFAPITAEILASEVGSVPTPAISFSPPQPSVAILPPELPSGALPEPEIEAPRIDENARLDISPFTARARLEPGSVAAVMLLLEIAPDGSVIAARVVRSNSGEAANEAAVDYARGTHWTPGMIDGVPRAMQASLTVILGESA